MIQRLLLTYAALLLCRACEPRMIDWTLIRVWLTHPFRKLAIPDFVYDKHNERDWLLKRFWTYFFDEGTILQPHHEIEGELEMRRQAMKAISDPSGAGRFD